jgi:UDPglucose 6-dehydrogenase
MRISVIGCGYVGAVTGACLGALGHEIVFVDIDWEKIEAINSARSPVFEPGLDELIARNHHCISAVTKIGDALKDAEIAFLCVGTPSNGDGSINLEYVRSAAIQLGDALKEIDHFCLVVVKSTVLPGTTENEVGPAIESRSGKKAGIAFGIASNPEFLREGNAVNDFFRPARIVIGTKDCRSRILLENLFATFDCPKMFTDIKTAEMIKYASNAALALKISFANEIGNVCKEMGIDAYEVLRLWEWTRGLIRISSDRE